MFDHLIVLLVHLFMGAVIVLGAVALFQVLKAAGRNVVTGALKEYVFAGVLAGERAVIWAFDQVEDWIEATDKKKVADSIYFLLPPVLAIGPVIIPLGLVKWLVPPEKFAELIKALYDQADAFIQSNEDHFRNQVNALKWEIDAEFDANGDIDEAIGSI